jgi:enamine deaminase RidA (YjgF/YER057c/UK114 family)
MDIKRFETGPRMSQAVVHNGTVYLAGQVGEAGSDVTEQTKQALAEVDRLLALAGTDKTRILSAQIWLADMADFLQDERRLGCLGAAGPHARPAPPANPSSPPRTTSSKSSSSPRSEPAPHG